MIIISQLLGNWEPVHGLSTDDMPNHTAYILTCQELCILPDTIVFKKNGLIHKAKL